MTRYALMYYGGPQFASPEEGAAYQQVWRAWMTGLGDAVINPGVPIGMPKTVTATAVTDNPTLDPKTRLTGFTVVQAATLDAVIAMVRSCPHIEHGHIDVAEAYDMM